MNYSLSKMRSNFNSENSTLGPTAAEPKVEAKSVAPLKPTLPAVKLPEPTSKLGNKITGALIYRIE